MLHGCYRGVTWILHLTVHCDARKSRVSIRIFWGIKRTLNVQNGNTVSARIFVMLHDIEKIFLTFSLNKILYCSCDHSSGKLGGFLTQTTKK